MRTAFDANGKIRNQAIDDSEDTLLRREIARWLDDGGSTATALDVPEVSTDITITRDYIRLVRICDALVNGLNPEGFLSREAFDDERRFRAIQRMCS